MKHRQDIRGKKYGIRKINKKNKFFYFVLIIIILWFSNRAFDLDFERFIFCLVCCYFGLGLRAIYYGLFDKDQKRNLIKKSINDCIIAHFYYLMIASALVSFIYLVYYENFNKLSPWTFYIISLFLFMFSGIVISKVAEHFLLVRKSGTNN